jgi:homogentisate 1,2-dioxygenase
LLKGFDLKAEDDFLDSRKALLVKDCTIGLAAPQKSLRTIFYKNADADEMIFIHKGREIRTMMGNIPFEYGDLLSQGLSIKLILIQQSIDCCMSNLSRLFIRQNDTKMNQANT